MSMSVHALLPLASQSVLHPLPIKFTESFLIQVLLKRLSTDVSFHKTTLHPLLLIIYKSFPSRVQLHQQPWWLLQTSSSCNSTAILLFINTLRLLLIPRIFNMISYLALTSLTNGSITLDYENHQVQWMEYTIPLHDALEFFQ